MTYPIRVLFVFCAVIIIKTSQTNEALSVCESAEDIPLKCYCEMNVDESDYPTYFIDCSFNSITSITFNRTLPEYSRQIDLSVNNLTSIEQNTILRSLTLRKILLQRNQIDKICENAFKYVPAVRHLDVSDNKLEVLDSNAFRGLKDLTYLNLASNGFKTLPPLLFKQVRSLDVLILDDNPVGDFLVGVEIFKPDGLSLNPKLSGLSVEGVGLPDFGEDFLRDAYNLRQLRLARNPINIFPPLPFTLDMLDLSDTLVSTVTEEDFKNMAAMKDLKLNNMPRLGNIGPNTFSAMHGLRNLELKSCMNLSAFSWLAFGEEVFDGTREFTLQRLTFRGSRLKRLNQSLEVLFGQLSELDLQGNPWYCDCNFLWIKRLQIDKHDYDHIRCATPIQLYNRRVYDLPEERLICLTPHHRLIVLGKSLLVILCLSLLGLATWLVFLMPQRHTRAHILQNMVSPGSPYSRITIEMTDVPRGIR